MFEKLFARSTLVAIAIVWPVVSPATGSAMVRMSATNKCVVPGQYDELQSWEIPLSITGLPKGAKPVATLADRKLVRERPNLHLAAVKGRKGLVGSLNVPSPNDLRETPAKGIRATVLLTDSKTHKLLASTHVMLGVGIAKLNHGNPLDSASTPIDWAMSGYGGPGVTYYAHYFTDGGRAAGTPVASYPIGTSNEVCGYLDVTRPLIPTDLSGAYEIVIDTYNPYGHYDYETIIPSDIASINASN